jgi:galactokinase
MQNNGPVLDQAPHAIENKFARLFGASPRIFQAPGRVNLIGEHTDYNDGFVMPAALDSCTWAAAAPRSDRKLVVQSENFHEQAEFALDQLPDAPSHHWADYVIGVAKMLEKSGLRLPGANLLLEGNVPQGAGLSSSASLEVAVCFALLGLLDVKMEPAKIARLCQRAENEFVGARCGIMDQFISVHGQRDHALRLDCRSLEYELLPLRCDARLVISNTMVRHSVAHGEYNQRRAECEAGVKLMAKHFPNVKALRDVKYQEFLAVCRDLPETIMRRCRHVISENERVLQAGGALESGNLEQFGALMRQSHESLRDDFQVSCPELDLMVELGSQVPGVYGARMTGGGFGGCTVNLVREDSVEAFVATVGAAYEKATGQKPEIYVCLAADGAHEVV